MKHLKNNTLAILFGAMMTIMIWAGFTATAKAQTTTTTRKTTVYYTKNYQAVNKQRLETRKGNYARVFYDNYRRKWAVEISSAVVTSRTRRTDGNWSADGGKLPNGASIIYSPTRELAESIYKASLRQGDWAKMWYDAKRGDWAVAVKPR